MQGGTDEVIEALRRNDLKSAALAPQERALMDYVRLLTVTPWKVTGSDAQRLRDAGWTDPQMAEAVYIIAMFAFFNRVADAFGLEDPGYFETKPSESKLPDDPASDA